MRRFWKKGEFPSLIALGVLLFIGAISFTISLSNKNKTTYKSQARERFDTGSIADKFAKNVKEELNPVPLPTEAGRTSGILNKVSDALKGLDAGGKNQCSQSSDGGNDCTKYLESVTAVGITDGGIIDNTTFSCDISTKNICGFRSDKDNICGVKINDGWPVWCPWNGTGQDLNASSIVSRGACNLSGLKPGDKLQIVAARAYGSCAEIPWNTSGSFIAGQTFYYKQKPAPPKPIDPPARGGGGENQDFGGGGQDFNGGDWSGGGQDYGGDGNDWSGGGGQNLSGGDNFQPSGGIIETSPEECTPFINERDSLKNTSSWNYDKTNNLLCFWLDGQETDCCTAPPSWYKK